MTRPNTVTAICAINMTPLPSVPAGPGWRVNFSFSRDLYIFRPDPNLAINPFDNITK